MADKIEGPFRCSPHKFATDGTKKLEVQEDDWYQHLRDHEHIYRVSKPCQNCGKKTAQDNVKGKVPQPTPEVKNPRSIIVYCSPACKTDYLKKLGVT